MKYDPLYTVYLPYTADEFIVNRVKEQLACETIHDADAAAAKKTYLAKIKTRQNQTKS